MPANEVLRKRRIFIDDTERNFLGVQVEIWSCNGGANQRFTFTPSGELRAYDNTKCLDVHNGDTAPGTRVALWDCHGGANQKFRLNADGTITATQSNLCLDVRGGATADGTQVLVWTCHGASNQVWTRR